MFIQAPNASSPQEPGDSVARDLVLTWLRTFVGRPHDGLGRSGDVCPYVSTALDVGAITVLIARGRPSRAEIEVAASEVRRMFLATPLHHPEVRILRSIVLAFPDMTAEDDRTLEAVQDALKPGFADAGLMLGEFHPRHDRPGLHNPTFRPLASIEPDPTAIVVGKLYTITKADILRLDFYELAPVMSHYYREQLTQDGKEFHVYRSTIVRDGLRPSPGYLKMILDGYGTMKDVPADYLGMLNATEALKELVPSDELEFVLRVEPWMPEPLKDVVVAVDRKCLVLFMKYLYARSVTEGLIRA